MYAVSATLCGCVCVLPLLPPPCRYGAGGNMFTLEEVKGGGPWGAGTFAGPTGARNPSEMELEQAEYEVRCRTDRMYAC